MNEVELHRWHRSHSVTKAGFILGSLGGELRYWPGSAAVELARVEALDDPGECEAVAVDVHRRFGFAVCFGWRASDSHNPTGHCWNLTERGEVVDAANARSQATGYLGIVLAADELRFLDYFNRPAVAVAA